MVMISFCSSWHSAQGVLVEGYKCLLDGEKEIVYFFDIHNQVEWKDREKDELEDLVQIFKKYGQSSGKPVHILIEGVWDPWSSDSVLSMLSTRLAQEELTSAIVIENIELRAASAIVQDLIRLHLQQSPTNPRVSSTQVFYPEEVTFSDVLHEFFLITASLEENYKVSSYKVKEIHDKEMSFIQYFVEKKLKQTLENNAIPLDKPVALLLEECLTEEKRDVYNTLRIMIYTLSNCFIDLYAFHRVLAISSDYKIVLIAGGEHSKWVKSQIMLRLDAIQEYQQGDKESGALSQQNIVVPLTKDQLKSVLYA